MTEKIVRCGVEINPDKGGSSYHWTVLETRVNGKTVTYYLRDYASMAEALQQLPFDYINWLSDKEWTNKVE
jgi:hypothetical protein